MTATTISEAAHRCLASFDAIDQVSISDAPGCPPNEDGRGRFQIWAYNLGSLHPGTDRRSADYRLREAPEVVDRIVELLDELGEINSDILEILSGARANRPLSESDDDSESSDELSELNLSVGDIITSLFKVSMLVKKATARDRYAKAASAKEAAFLADFDIRHVADKFPKLRTQPWLLERLGSAITQRRQFLRYCRNHKRRIAHVEPQEPVSDGRLPRPTHPDGNLDVPIYVVNAPSTTNTPLTRPTLTPTTASTLHAEKIVQEDLQDLDRDDAASQATSVAYSQTDQNESGTLHVPRLEDVSQGMQPFECPFCFSIVQAKRQHSWRKHVLSDLRAYVCMSSDCDVGLFEDKFAWQAHEIECHQRQWSCTQCHIGPFTSATSLQTHLLTRHKTGDLPKDVISKMVDSSSHPLSEVAPDCPMCDFQDDVRRDANEKGQNLSSSAQIVVPLPEYHRHLAFHQEQLALFAIPPAIERSLESESNHGRSKADPQENVQLMARWQESVEDTVIEDGPGNLQHTTVDALAVPAPERSGLDDADSSGASDDHRAPEETTIGDPSLYMPAEGEFPTILTGDIVYIPHETGEQLSYRKGVYLGRNEKNKHIVRDWKTWSEIEVSVSTLVRKTECTTEEEEEAALLEAYQTREDEVHQPRHYRKNYMLSAQACETLLHKTHELAIGNEEIKGYDEGLVKPIFSRFGLHFSGRTITNGIMLEDIIRIFYDTATSEQSNDLTSSDAMWKADVERSAALLIGVLIEIVETQHDSNEGLVAQLRAEQAQMIARANEAVKLASSNYFRQSFTDRQSTFDDADGNPLKINSETLEALKLRVQDVANSREQLPGFEDDDVKRTFVAFSEFLDKSAVGGTSLVDTIVRDFRGCALFVLNMDNTLSRAQRNAMTRRQEALLLSLLISVDARVQFKFHGSDPRIRSRFTTVLMEERAKLSFSASRSQAASDRDASHTEANNMTSRTRDTSPSGLASTLTYHLDTPAASAVEIEPSHNNTQSSKEGVMERPRRALRCYACQHTWTSTLAADLRDCPKCGSYSVIADSPRRTASPENTHVPRRTIVQGEEALGQYFSERTAKYMSLYRQQQPLPMKSDSHESLPNPWKHIHNPLDTQVSRIPPREGGSDAPVKICYTCRHHFAPPAVSNDGECPKCGSEFVFTDLPWNMPSDVPTADASEQFGHGTLTHDLGIGPPQLFAMIHDIEDVASKLQGLQDRYSKNTRDIPEAVDQLSCLGTGFRRLAKLQEDPHYRIRMDAAQETVHVLYASIQYTVDSALETLRIPLDETQWMRLSAFMRDVEQTDILERLRWYQASILGLLDHLDGFTSESLVGMDANMRSLLERQRKARPSGLNERLFRTNEGEKEVPRKASPSRTCYACNTQLPDSAESEAGACPNCGSWFLSEPETSPGTAQLEKTARPNLSLESVSASSVQPHHQVSTSQQLARLISDTEHVAARLQRLQNEYFRNTTGVPEIIEQLLGLRDSFRKLSQICEDPRHAPNFVEVQEPTQALCRSTQCTLNAILKVLTMELEPDETVWTKWIMLTIKMAEAEKVGLPERLKWYSASVLGLLNHLDGFPSAGRIFQWLGMDEKIRALLERQENSEE